ncbi:MAG: SPOR domain-containing protein [Desulfuromonadaceae bacterium]|nr:SPOR domain-containing protein [Desulfuromonadaceae bacterium]MDD2856921.1 SPOR domain-containing protein [Desulfuromonadaceae bacterium]
MDFKFSKDSSDSRNEDVPSDEKKKQSALLVLLLILVGGFTYVYFFTDLVKPQSAPEAAAPVTPAVQKPAVVKLPLPPREGEGEKDEEKKPDSKAAPEAPVAVSGKPAKAAVVTDKKVQTVAVKSTLPPPKVTPTAKAVVKKDEPKKEALKSEIKKNVQPAPASKKVAAASAKPEEKKNVTAPKRAAETPKSVAPVNSSPAAWSITVGNYLLEEELAADMGRVRKAGFQPVIKPSSRKKASMSRLLVAEFADRSSAQPTLDKLKRQTADAFVVEEGGRFAVVAGSYLNSEAARSEKDRLKSAGFEVALKQVDLSIPTQSLSVGPFTSKKVAESAAAKLKSSGLKVSLSQK